MNLDSWYHVSFDDKYIYRKVSPPGKEKWSDKLKWSTIKRICYRTGSEFYETDEIYIFTFLREESYLIPMEAYGASELFNEIINKIYTKLIFCFRI